MSAWKPGDVVTGLLDGNEIVGIVRGGGRRMFYADSVTTDQVDLKHVRNLRALVVIDPEDREQARELLVALLKQHDPLHPDASDLQAALREFANPTPPRIGLGEHRWLEVPRDVHVEPRPHRLAGDHARTTPHAQPRPHALNRLLGAAQANTDAIAAYAELVDRVEALATGLLVAKTPEFDSKAAHPELAYRRCKVPGCNMWVWGQGTASPNDLRYCVAHDTAATIATALRALIDPEATS